MSERFPSTIDELLQPELLGSLDRLDIVSRKILNGKLPGERRGKRRGQSVEFDDYRPYVPGDDLRHIDWNVYARSERFFLKLFREEEDLSLDIIIDDSPSMRVALAQKALFAHRLAIALAYIGLVNHNRVACEIIAPTQDPPEQTPRRLAPMRGRRNLPRIASFILQNLNAPQHPSRRTPSFHDTCRNIAMTRKTRGVLVLISDMLFREGFLPGLNFIAARAQGFDTAIVQVLAPDEIDPARGDLVGDLRLIDAESALAAEITVSKPVIAQYRKRLEQHQTELVRACHARQIAHTLVQSDASVRDLILSSLRMQGLVA